MSVNPMHAYHHTEYADPLLRPPSPASSVGTAYDPDQTSHSDGELSQPAFEKKCEERIRLHIPRPEEISANMEPLLFVTPLLGGKPVWWGETELDQQTAQTVHQAVMASLRSKVAAIKEDEIFEDILLRGSKIAYEPNPTSNDVDALMRSMMGPAMNLGGAYMGRNDEGRKTEVETTGPGITNGPWNNFGQPATTFQRSMGSATPGGETMLSGTTIGGKRSRNGTSRKP
ncbi:hypothetical protein NLJ89_g510 [Agrocybe chaxingu]|uniref:Uncharacterized protein n=1 Tax=Agrocybe chaxingu TaxID=84603 RepID=A0A9W8N1T2_9AGAR|nr:hypothetical protein NLJ89_g510 [Agrocybe chaxingu]